jgi:hypothetical protein
MIGGREMKKIKQCLNECELFFRWIDRRTYGIIEWDKERITINIELLIVEVFVHEYLHWRFPEKGERWIEKETNRRLERMTLKQMSKYAKIIFKHARMK